MSSGHFDTPRCGPRAYQSDHSTGEGSAGDVPEHPGALGSGGAAPDAARPGHLHRVVEALARDRAGCTHRLGGRGLLTPGDLAELGVVGEELLGVAAPAESLLLPGVGGVHGPGESSDGHGSSKVSGTPTPASEVE